MKRTIKQLLLFLLVGLWLTAQAQRSWAQEDFPDDEFDEPPTMNGNGAPGAPPNFPPLPPPPAAIDNGGGATSAPPPPPSGGSSFGGGGRIGHPGSGGPTSLSGKRVDMAHAQPEDITDENFPDLIESFDYPNADIKDVIKAMSELTGKNFILDNNVSGKITIIAPTRITVAEAYKAFLSALAINSLTIVPSGKFLKITNSANAKKNNIETYAGTYYPTSDVMITRIVSLKYISAKDLRDRLTQLVTKDGQIDAYEQTNSLIIADYGSNVERMAKIIAELDKPGFDEQLEVIMLKHAKSRDIADIVMQVINKESSGGKASRYAPRLPRFNQPGTPKGGGAEQLSMVAPDERTNSLIVLGNRAGLDKVRALVKKLDFGLSDEAGGVFVYYVKHGEAEKIAATLNGVAGDANKNKGQGGAGQPPGFAQPPSYLPPTGAEDAGAGLFGGEVKITAEKLTNSLIITASKTDYEVIKRILEKIDIPRDQVFVEAIIMELNAGRQNSWGINYYQFAAGADNKVVGRSGFSSNPSSTGVTEYFDPTKDSGAILSFAQGSTLTLPIPGASGATATVTSMLGFLKFLTTNNEGSILSNPRIVTSNNEESTIEVGQKVPVAINTSSTAAGLTSQTQFENATIKLVMTPFISPNDDTVRMKIKQTVADVTTPSNATKLNDAAATLATRMIETNISVKSGDTAVLGGLIRNQDDVKITKVPLLGDIPILGWLFKGQTVNHDRKNMVVFITPKVLRTVASSHEVLDKRLDERIDYVKENMRGEDPFGKRADSLPRRGEMGEPEPQPVPKMPKRSAELNQNLIERETPKAHGEVEDNTQQLIDETLQNND